MSDVISLTDIDGLVPVAQIRIGRLAAACCVVNVEGPSRGEHRGPNPRRRAEAKAAGYHAALTAREVVCPCRFPGYRPADQTPGGCFSRRSSTSRLGRVAE